MDSHSTPDSEGPLPGSKWMTPVEYREAMTLFLELQFGAPPPGIGLAHDPNWPGWIFVQFPHPTKSDQHIIVALPLSDGPWGTAVSAAFYWITADEDK